MDIANMYKIINEKDKSFHDFIKFIDFMFDNKDKIHLLKNDIDKQNFNHHFEKIPTYTREMLGKLRHKVIGDISNANNLMRRVSENVDKYTTLE